MRRRLALLGEQPSWVWPTLRVSLIAAVIAGVFVLGLAGVVIHSLPRPSQPEAEEAEAEAAPAPTTPPPWLSRLLDRSPAAPVADP